MGGNSSSVNRRRDKQCICVFYASVKSRYAVVLKIKRSRYAERFSYTQITAVWCVSILLTFLSILQTNEGVQFAPFTAINGRQSSLEFLLLWTYCKWFCNNAKTKDSRCHDLSSLEAKVIGMHVQLWNIFYTTQSSNIVCFPIIWSSDHLTCPILSSFLLLLSVFFFLSFFFFKLLAQEISTIFFFFCIPMFWDTEFSSPRLYLNINQFCLKDDLKMRKQAK